MTPAASHHPCDATQYIVYLVMVHASQITKRCIFNRRDYSPHTAREFDLRAHA